MLLLDGLVIRHLCLQYMHSCCFPVRHMAAEVITNLAASPLLLLPLLQGEPRCVAQAIYIVTAAVDRYKELCEGRYSGEHWGLTSGLAGVAASCAIPFLKCVPMQASTNNLCSLAARLEYSKSVRCYTCL
jgi:hypothetical protein